MSNFSQTEKNIKSLVYIIIKSKPTISLLKNGLKKTIDEAKISVLKNIEELPANFDNNTYIIIENNKTFISKVSKISPKRNIKLFVYIESIYNLNTDDLIFFIKHDIDHIIHPENIKYLNYEKFIDSKIFKKKHYNAFIDKESSLLADLCQKFDDTDIAPGGSRGINIYGISNHIRTTVEKAYKISQSDSNVLITGESGTGKELIARLIHGKSNRNQKPMVSINCGAFPEGLLESELFGYKKGAFTGAFNDKPGRFELADKSTIFLDEIGDMSLSLQVKLLRVIQEREIEPIGAIKAKKIDARIISATNKNLEDLISKNMFREDFYYRINVIPIHLAPLRERKTDIIILIYYFLKKFSAYQNNQIYGMSEDALLTLLNYAWYGNIREIENLIEMLVVLNESGLITNKDIPEKYFKSGANTENNQIEKKDIINNLTIPDIKGMQMSSEGCNFNLKDKIEEIEFEIIRKAMETSGGVKEKAARMLGLNRTTLIEKLKRYEKSRKK